MNIGSRMAMWSGGKKLPYARKLAYLESDGSQYIDTGIKLSGDVWFNVDYMINNKSATYKRDADHFVIGSEDGILNNSIWWSYQYDYYLLRYKSSQKLTTFFTEIAKSVYPPNRGIVGFKDGNFICAGVTTKAFDKTSFTSTKTVKLFAASRGDVMLANNGCVRIYGVECGDLTNSRKIIPVMSHEGRPEMFDELSGTFMERHGDFGYGEID